MFVFFFFFFLRFFSVTSLVSTWRDITSCTSIPAHRCVFSARTLHIVSLCIRFGLVIIFWPRSTLAKCEPCKTKHAFQYSHRFFFVLFWPCFFRYGILFAKVVRASVVAGCRIGGSMCQPISWFFIINKMPKPKPKPQSKQIYYDQLRWRMSWSVLFVVCFLRPLSSSFSPLFRSLSILASVGMGIMVPLNVLNFHAIGANWCWVHGANTI